MEHHSKDTLIMIASHCVPSNIAHLGMTNECFADRWSSELRSNIKWVLVMVNDRSWKTLLFTIRHGLDLLNLNRYHTSNL
jgi:hypothetical protein